MACRWLALTKTKKNVFWMIPFIQSSLLRNRQDCLVDWYINIDVGNPTVGNTDYAITKVCGVPFGAVCGTICLSQARYKYVQEASFHFCLKERLVQD